MKKLLSSFLWIVFCLTLNAQIPPGYYNTAAGKKGYALKQVLHDIIKNHTVISYSALWTAYQRTDLKSNGKIWDMYSNVPNGTPPYEFTFRVDQCGTSRQEGDCYSREHVFCQSWFGGTTEPPYSDLFHIYPVDQYVNMRRNNYAFGEVSAPSWTSLNGGKLGKCTVAGFTGTCFEPIDAYKGDIARSLLYMTVRYQTEDANFASSDMTVKSQIKPWALAMLKQWHRNDPVSDKEKHRNDSVYKIQNKRNPFIDYPELVEIIFGDDSVTTTFNPPIVTDNVKPYITESTISSSNNSIKLVFNRILSSATAGNRNNYILSESVPVISAVDLNGSIVTLRFSSALTSNHTYYLTVKNIQDAFGNNTIKDTTLALLVKTPDTENTLIAWTFDNLAAAPNTPQVIPANFYTSGTDSAFIYLNGTHGSDIFITSTSSTQLTSFEGTELGDPRATPYKGRALAIANTTSNDRYMVLKFGTTGYHQLNLHLAVQRTNTGFNAHEWEWSLDAEEFTQIENSNTCPDESGSFFIQNLDLSEITEIENQPVVFLRFRGSGANGATGNNRLDNISVQGHPMLSVPENQANAIKIYPNPTDGTLHIIGKEANKIEITDMSGRLVNVSLPQPVSLPITINLSALTSGVYLIHVYSGKDRFTEKFIKQ